jgi:hypothetical protein
VESGSGAGPGGGRSGGGGGGSSGGEMTGSVGPTPDREQGGGTSSATLGGGSVGIAPGLSMPGSEQQYSLRWNDYHVSILSSFRHLRDEEDFVDVTLACDGCSFSAHKVVLSACSPYFRRLLKVRFSKHCFSL